MHAAEKAEPVAVDHIVTRLEELAIPTTRARRDARHVDSLRAKPSRSDSEYIMIKAFEEWPLDGQMATVPVQAFRAGEIAFVGLPGEISLLMAWR